MARRFARFVMLLIPILFAAGAIPAGKVPEDPPATPGDPTTTPAYWLAKASADARIGPAGKPAYFLVLVSLGQAQSDVGALDGARKTAAKAADSVKAEMDSELQPYEVHALALLQISAGMTGEANETLERFDKMSSSDDKPGSGEGISDRLIRENDRAVDLARLGRRAEADEWISLRPRSGQSRQHLEVAAALIEMDKHSDALDEIEKARKTRQTRRTISTGPSRVATTRPANAVATRSQDTAIAQLLAFAGETELAWSATTQPTADAGLPEPVSAAEILGAAYAGHHRDVAQELAKRGLKIASSMAEQSVFDRIDVAKAAAQNKDFTFARNTLDQIPVDHRDQRYFEVSALVFARSGNGGEAEKAASIAMSKPRTGSASRVQRPFKSNLIISYELGGDDGRARALFATLTPSDAAPLTEMMVEYAAREGRPEAAAEADAVSDVRDRIFDVEFLTWEMVEGGHLHQASTYSESQSDPFKPAAEIGIAEGILGYRLQDRCLSPIDSFGLKADW